MGGEHDVGIEGVSVDGGPAGTLDFGPEFGGETYGTGSDREVVDARAIEESVQSPQRTRLVKPATSGFIVGETRLVGIGSFEGGIRFRPWDSRRRPLRLAELPPTCPNRITRLEAGT